MKICMLGAGALGCAIGGTLAEAGSDVTLIDRFQEHVDAINRDGLRMNDGASERKVMVKAVTECRGLARADLVIVLVKSFHTREAIESAAAIVGTIWDKLLINVATGALSGITGLPYGGLYAVPEIEACAIAAVAEAMAVARGGRKYGIATPVNASLVACIKGIEYRLTHFAAKAGA